MDSGTPSGRGSGKEGPLLLCAIRPLPKTTELWSRVCRLAQRVSAGFSCGLRSGRGERRVKRSEGDRESLDCAGKLPTFISAAKRSWPINRGCELYFSILLCNEP